MTFIKPANIPLSTLLKIIKNTGVSNPPLYFTEIYDRQLQPVPINTFQEIDALNVPTAAPIPKDIDTLSNEGSDAASDEGDELSDEGSDMDGSNEVR